MPNITYPTVHLNGTSREALIEEYTKAFEAVMAAQQVLAHVTVHGRDYYVQGPDAYRQARDQHMARLDALEKVGGELAQIVFSLQAH